MGIDKAQAKDRFQEFLIIMDDQLEWLEDEARKRSIALDMSPASFGKLEELFDLMAKGQSEDNISRLIVIFARYLGEIVRVNYGGNWELPLDDEKSINFNTPIIVGHTSIEGLEFAPLLAMRGYMLRGESGTLQQCVDADIDPHPLDLSHLPDEDPPEL